MKEEDLSTIKRYPITEYLNSKGITPVRQDAKTADAQIPASDNAAEAQPQRAESPEQTVHAESAPTPK